MYKRQLNVGATTTINAIAAAPNYSTSVLASGSYTIGAPLPVTRVNFGSVANVYAIGKNGSAVLGTGIDGGEYAYSGTLLEMCIRDRMSWKLWASACWDGFRHRIF